MAQIPYTKSASTIQQQIQKLIQRGLAVPDVALAAHHIQFIGYYRLMGYGLTFYDKRTKQYAAGKTFDDLIEHYTFDRELRVIAMDEIERIEIAIRSVIVDEMSRKHGPHWYLDHTRFQQLKKEDRIYGELIRKVEVDTGRSTELFIHHYHATYKEPYLVPAWMAAECLSFGIWSKIYRALPRQDRLPIANVFGLRDDEMSSFIRSLTVVRNACAHHARIFDRAFSFKPTPTHQLNGLYVTADEKSFYVRAAVMHIFLKKILPVNHWPTKLQSLFANHPNISLASMKFPVGWETLPFWQ